MQKNILVYGLIAGFLVSFLMLFTSNTITNFNAALFAGYASMVLAFSLVFVGTRNYRDKYNNGVLSFGQAFKIGILMVLIASTIYVIVWLIAYFYFEPGYLDKLTLKMNDKLRASGAGQAAIDKQTKEMADFAVQYKNPIFNAMMTYIEILPVGILVTLISSFILKRKTATIANN